MFLDDSACNLASLNLLKFAPNGTFDVAAYRHAVDILITAQEILVDNAGYPTEIDRAELARLPSARLGYANLGALLMASGLPYDSDAGRDYAACVTAIMCGEAYLQSSASPNSASRWPRDRADPESSPKRTCGCRSVTARRSLPRLVHQPRAVPRRHPHAPRLRSTTSTRRTFPPVRSTKPAKPCWDEALAHGEKHGYRNSQVTVLAPTGTIGFMMDCDTTGIEPDLALVKYKKLVGGGMIKIVNNTVPSALFKLGYTHDQANAIVSYIDATGTIEGAPAIKDEHLAVFDCSFKPPKGTRTIHYMGHLKMMAATQPFISGAISKTVNLPENASVEDIAEAYLQAWSWASRRSPSTATTPRRRSRSAPCGSRHRASRTREDAVSRSTRSVRYHSKKLRTHRRARRSAAPVRHRLPDERTSITHKFNVGGHEGYITVGLYPTASPARSSSPWPRKAPPSPASWTASPPPSPSPSSTACRSSCSARSSPTPASSPAAGAATPTSASPSRSWITSSAGSSSASSPDSSRCCSTTCA